MRLRHMDMWATRPIHWRAWLVLTAESSEGQRKLLHPVYVGAIGARATRLQSFRTRHTQAIAAGCASSPMRRQMAGHRSGPFDTAAGPSVCRARVFRRSGLRVGAVRASLSYGRVGYWESCHRSTGPTQSVAPLVRGRYRRPRDAAAEVLHATHPGQRRRLRSEALLAARRVRRQMAGHRVRPF